MVKKGSQSRTLEERFWPKVQKTSGCWRWTASGTLDGYGQLRMKGVRYYAHHLSVIFSGREIPQGSIVMHHCDNPPCVRPDHLFVGTRSDNQKDSFTKGRGFIVGRKYKRRGTTAILRD
jgi:hypothetical protein